MFATIPELAEMTHRILEELPDKAPFGISVAGKIGSESFEVHAHLALGPRRGCTITVVSIATNQIAARCRLRRGIADLEAAYVVEDVRDFTAITDLGETRDRATAHRMVMDAVTFQMRAQRAHVIQNTPDPFMV